MILLVEDFSPLRQTLNIVLHAQGYEVHAFGELQPARAWLHTHASKLHALICDYTLPDGKGTELLAEAEALAPKARLCLISGYGAPPEVISKYIFLAKPFRIEELLQAIAHGASA